MKLNGIHGWHPQHLQQLTIHQYSPSTPYWTFPHRLSSMPSLLSPKTLGKKWSPWAGPLVEWLHVRCSQWYLDWAPCPRSLDSTGFGPTSPIKTWHRSNNCHDVDWHQIKHSTTSTCTSSLCFDLPSIIFTSSQTQPNWEAQNFGLVHHFPEQIVPSQPISDFSTLWVTYSDIKEQGFVVVHLLEPLFQLHNLVWTQSDAYVADSWIETLMHRICKDM